MVSNMKLQTGTFIAKPFRGNSNHYLIEAVNDTYASRKLQTVTLN